VISDALFEIGDERKIDEIYIEKATTNLLENANSLHKCIFHKFQLGEPEIIKP
jgi:hypothetical protein